MMTQRFLHILPIGLLIAVLSACSGSAGALPTQNPALNTQIALAMTVTAAPTRTATPPGTQQAAFGPVVGPTLVGVSDQPVHSATPLAIATQPGSQPTFGAVIGTGYTPPPSATPISSMPPMPATSSAPTATFGALIDPNYTPPPTQTTAPEVIPNVTLPPVATDAPPVAASTLRASLMGIQIHANLTDTDWAAMLDKAQTLGVGWIKVQIAWSESEPQQGVFTERYKGLVLQIQRAHLRGFHTLLTIAKAPAWARPNGAASLEDGPPTNALDFASFVGKLVADVKPEFIDAIEVWNEPNLQREWRDKPISGAEYMILFRPTYEAIIAEQQKQLTPQHRIMVIIAGPAPTYTAASGSSLDDRTWLQQVYDAGAAQYGDDVAIGAHPYGWVNPPDATCCEPQPGVTGWYESPVFYFRNTIDDYRAIMLRNNDEQSKLWVTEFGWATFDGLKRSDGSAGQPLAESGWQGVLTQAQQAAYTLRAFALAEHDPYYAFMGPMILWNLNFATLPGFVDSSREESAFSLLDQSGAPRPVFTAIQNAPKEPPAVK